MNFIKIFIVEYVYSQTQRMFKFYEQNEINHNIFKKKQKYKQSVKKESSDTLYFAELSQSPLSFC